MNTPTKPNTFSSDAKRTCLIVAGMHRSGTSALARAVNLLGFAAPKNLLGAEDFNEAGHWEPERIVAVHDELLALCESQWDDWRPLDLASLSTTQRRHYTDLLRDLLQEEFLDSENFVLKDPRICRMLPFYQQILKSFRISDVYILPFRNPLEVCDSLARRNQMGRAYGGLVWLRHVVDAEFFTRGRARSFCSYDDFLRDHSATLSKLSDQMGLTWPVPYETASALLQDHVRNDLQHHAADLEDLDASPEINSWIRTAYKALLDLKSNPDDPEAQTQLDLVRMAFDEAAAKVGTATFIEFSRRENDIRRKNHELGSELDRAKDTAEETQGHIRKLEDDILSAHQHAERLDAELTGALDRVGTLQSEADALRMREVELSETFQKRQDELVSTLSQRNADLSFLQEQVIQLTSSTSWRITRPLRGFKRALTEPGFAPALLRSVARKVLFALPISRTQRNRLLKTYHDRRLRNSVLSAPAQSYPVPSSVGTKADHEGTQGQQPSGLEPRPPLHIPDDGRWNIEEYRARQAEIAAYLAALSRPDDTGAVWTEEVCPPLLEKGPMVSIIVRTYAGRAPLLQVALKSLAEQTYRPIEIVVVEDRTEELRKVVDALNFDEGIQLRYVSSPAGGRSEAANVGLDTATGTYIGFLDDDDFLTPDHCARLAGVLEDRRDVAAAYAASIEIGADLDRTTMTFSSERENAVFLTGLANSNELFHRNGFPIQAVLFRAAVCTEHDRFNPNFDALEDWLFWMRMLVGHPIAAIAAITSGFYVPRSKADHRRRIEAHIAAEPLFAVQRNALFEERQLTDMEPVNRQIRTDRQRALERAALPLRQGSRPAPSLPDTPLMRALQGDVAPSIVPRYEPKIVAFTSINLRYLPKALAWARSVKSLNPDWETHILLNDAVPKDAHTWPDVDVVYPIRALNVPNFESWAYKMRVVELCTATKPFYAKTLLDAGFEYVFYFDPDTYAYSDLNALIAEFGDNDVLITPHCSEEAVSDAEIHFNEMSSLAHGVYNLGFLGLKQSEVGHKVAAFWARRLLRHCADDHGRGLFTDQKWFNLVPVFFEKVKTLKHKGCNTASWNIAHRPISRENGVWMAGGEPLIFFHFSGYDRNVPRAMFDVFGRFNKSLETLIDDYDKSNEHFARLFPAWKDEWAFARYDNGMPVLDAHREIYRVEYQNQLAFNHPFQTGPNSYLEHLVNIGDAAVASKVGPSGFIRRYF